MTIQHKTFTAEIESKSAGGGRIVISTADVDRDHDRVMPRGAILDNYLKNPVVMWGHNYYDPADMIGRATNLEVTDAGIMADFELRPAANDQDPQNIVRLLWDGGWVRTASIGFRPIEMTPNEFGGNDIRAWELLEFSLVSVPANAAALRLAAKALDKADDLPPAPTPTEPEPEPTPGPEPEPVLPTEPEPPAPAGKGNDSEPEAPAQEDTGEADAIEAAAQELRLAAILEEFVLAIRPYLHTE